MEKDRLNIRRIFAVALLSAVLRVRSTLGQGPPVEVQAIVKGTALLPCDILPPLINDSVILVIWFKNEMVPFYSYDARNKHKEFASHWKDTDLLGERGYFRTVTTPATLSLSDVTEKDEGLYRCRVDFRQSPSRNTRVNLSIIVPPQKPTIFDERGKEVTSIAGPYEENGEMRLTCIVSGGRPPPTVRWWRGERLLDAREIPSAFVNVKRSQLVIPRLERADLNSVFTCQASNNNISQPAEASVAIDMHFRPLGATILSSEQPVSAQRQYEVVCRTVGSRPPAKVNWYLDNTRLSTSVDTIVADGNETVSTLKLTPRAVDNDKLLTCRAENPKLRAAVEEDAWRLSVFFLPKSELQLGSSLNPDDIEEGDDVYFECKVNANPTAYKVTWRHNEQILQHNQAAGVIVSNHALALQTVSKYQSGNYTCTASNIEGDGVSNTVVLSIMYKPVCKSGLQRVYAVARHEAASVLCEVETFPLPDSFRWAFNNSAESVEVPQSRYNSSHETSSSVLRYAPVADMDYGTVLCWAANRAGRQLQPCVFHVIPAGIPDAPFNCSILNQTSRSLHLHCLEGFDGGQQQTFLLEIADSASGRLLFNLSSRIPSFAVEGLAAGQHLQFVIYAANSKGRSEPVQLEGFTLKEAEKQTGSPTQFEISPVLGVLLGLLLVLLVVAVTVFATFRLRSRHRHRPSRPSDLALKDKSTIYTQDMYDKDEKNPDVIPCNTGTNVNPASGSQTPGELCRTGNGDGGVTPLSPAQHQATATMDRQKTLPPSSDNVSSPGQHRLVTYTGPLFPEAEAAFLRQGKLYEPPRRAVHPSSSVLTSPVSPVCGHPLREIVTVRTPLMSAAQQESCV